MPTHDPTRSLRAHCSSTAFKAAGPTRLAFVLSAAATVTSLSGCQDEQEFVGQFAAPVVYGDDDRMEVYHHPDPSLAEIARQSVVALIDSGSIQRGPDGLYTLFASSLQEQEALCDGEAFINQPTAAFCSGVLIEDDLILTAGHCVRTQAQCEGIRFVFDYFLEGPSTLASIDDDDVYGCRQIVVRDEASNASVTPDFAVIQLDRPVTGNRTPVPIRAGATPLPLGEPVAMIGFGSGLPAKIDTGGAVIDPRASTLDHFETSTDAFGGHSGSPTFDGNLELAGILVAGRGPDYIPSPSEACARVNRFPDGEGGESVHYVAPILSRLCAEGWNGELCGGEPSCSGEACGPVPTPRTAPSGSSGCQAAGAIPVSDLRTVLSALLFLLLGTRTRPKKRLMSAGYKTRREN